MNKIIILVSLAFFGMLSTANAQSWTPPSEADRCPSKWGPDDERGSANHMGAASVLRANSLIREGEVVELGHVLHAGIPLGNRHYDLYVKPTAMNPQSNQRGSNEELVTTELGQVGTQLDGFSHQSIGDSFYNCVSVSEIQTRSGFTRLGIENVGTLMTRGILIDVAKLKGVQILPEDYVITTEDLQDALEDANLTLEPGDAVIINTGWGRYWTRDVEKFLGPAPGIGIPAAEWIVDQDPMIVGADNQPVEIQPNPDPLISLPIHQIMLAVNGIHLLERMNLEELAAREVYEFAFVLQPLKILGATGASVAPVAIY
ncbi:MAG: cyclase family protein [Candidatus Rariloculaceae bacterium]